MSGANIPDQEENRWKEAFGDFDRNGDGRIDRAELAQVMRLCNTDPTDKDINEMLDKADIDSDGKLSYVEFRKVMCSSYKDQDTRKGEYIEAFRMFDKNGDGTIDKVELIEVLQLPTGCELSMAEAEEMIREADKNKDGVISYEEFVDQLVKPAK